MPARRHRRPIRDGGDPRAACARRFGCTPSRTSRECRFSPGVVECLDLGKVDTAQLKQIGGQRRGGPRRLRLHRDGRPALPVGGDRRPRHRARQQGGAGGGGRAPLGTHGDPGRAVRNQGLCDAPDGQGAAGHSRHDPRGAAPRARPRHARARAEGDPPRPADDERARASRVRGSRSAGSIPTPARTGSSATRRRR